MGAASRKSRTASLHDDSYASFVKVLVELRKESGLNQRDVASALDWNQSIIAKIETKQRRIDVVELIRIAAVIGFDPASLVKKIQRELALKDGS